VSLWYYSGLDLGQASDFSALVVVESFSARLAARHLHRWPLGTPYTGIVADLKAMYAAGPLAGSSLVIDATGVGRAVVDMVRKGGINATTRAYTITAGIQPGDGTVPKKDLVGAVQAMLGQRRIDFAEGLELTPVLVKELEAFRVKVTADRNETFAAWRERDHDDLVLALALAVWYATKVGGGGSSPPNSNRPRSPLDGLPAGTFSGGIR